MASKTIDNFQRRLTEVNRRFVSKITEITFTAGGQTKQVADKTNNRVYLRISTPLGVNFALKPQLNTSTVTFSQISNSNLKEEFKVSEMYSLCTCAWNATSTAMGSLIITEVLYVG